MNHVVIVGEPSYLTSADPRGGLMYFHVTLLPSGSLAVLNVSHDPAEHKLDVVHYETSRKKLREEFEMVTRRSSARVGSAPGDYIAWRIQRAVADVRAAGTALSLRMENDLARLPTVTSEVSHPALALGPVPDAEARLLTQQSLFREPEFAVWVPPPRCIAILNERLQRHVMDLVKSRAESPESVESPDTTGDVFVRILHDSIDEFYDAPERASLALKLRDLALVFNSTRRRERALDALCLADAIEAAGATAAPHELGFLSLLQARAMSLLSNLYGSKRAAR